MTAPDSEEERSPWDWNETIFILLRHKWKFIVCVAAGFVAAGYTYYTHKPLYQSDAKLLVRYVLERSAIDPVDSQMGTTGGRYSDGVINSEIEILTSWDLALQVAEAIGPATLFPGSQEAPTKTRAAEIIRGGLTAKAAKGSNVISVSYAHSNPDLAVRVLEALVRIYFDKHLSVHRSLGAFDFVAKQSNESRSRLLEIEEQLKQLKSTVGIVSLSEATSTTQTLITRKREELASAESKLAGQRARVKAVDDWLVATRGSAGSDGTPATTAIVQQYQVITAQLAALRREGLDLMAKFTPENRLVRANQEQVGRLEAKQLELEQRHPELITASHSGGAKAGSGLDLMSEKTHLAVLEAETSTIRGQLAMLERISEELANVAPQIIELERRKEVEDANYKYFQASLEKARVDEALDPSKIPNISTVQSPSPATASMDDLNKLMLILIGGGAGLGLISVAVSGYVLDRTIKRPRELETKLNLSCLAAIPRFPNAHPTRPMRVVRENGSTAHALKEGHSEEKSMSEIHGFLRPHSEALRDRLILSLHLAGKTHNPKLIAVTGCSSGAGASTLAESLAASLSRTGGGKVLLVDMHQTRPAGNGRFAGTPKFSLFELLQTNGQQVAPAAENLYLASATSPAKDESIQLLPANFHNLVPRFKGSDFDYVIFDTPPVSESSTSLVMAGFMDKVLLVVEADKSTPGAIKRAQNDLLVAKADIGVVFNKATESGPRWLNEI